MALATSKDTALNASTDIANVAERYVKLVLAMGQHDASYVDAYYGPPEWQDDAAAQQLDLAAIAAGAQAALALLPSPTGLPEELVLRALNLTKQLQALLPRVEMMQGQHLAFDEESARL